VVTRLAATLIVLGVACGGGSADTYKPRLVGEQPNGKGLAPNTGETKSETAADSSEEGGTLASDKSDAKADIHFKVRKCTTACVHAWKARSAHGAYAAIERDCDHRCRLQWFTCTAAIDHALVLVRKNKLRREMLMRDGQKDVRNRGLRECQRRRWALDTLGCMLAAKSMDAFDDCEDAGRKRRQRRRRSRR